MDSKLTAATLLSTANRLGLELGGKIAEYRNAETFTVLRDGVLIFRTDSRGRLRAFLRGYEVGARE